MKTTVANLLKRHRGKILFGGLCFYVAIAGSTGSCPTCGLITQALTLNLPPFVASAQAAEPASAKAPAWVLKDTAGKVVKSSDFAGKVVVLDFWATWCPPCKMEIPGFVALQKKYGDKGLVVVGVSLDEGGPEVVNPFMKEFGINYPIVMGDEKVVRDFGGIEGIPTTFIIDRKGRVAARHVGFGSEDAFEQTIIPLL